MQRSRGSQLVHPRLMGSLGYQYNSECTILEEKIVYDDLNHPTITYTPDKFMKAIPCYYEPMTAGTGEDREAKLTIVSGWFNVYLQGYYPRIETKHKAQIQGMIYNIDSVAHDDTRSFTTLVIEIVDPNREQDTE